MLTRSYRASHSLSGIELSFVELSFISILCYIV